jgi:hypothetical protein
MPTKLAVDQVAMSPQTIEEARPTIAIIGRGPLYPLAYEFSQALRPWQKASRVRI